MRLPCAHRDRVVHSRFRAVTLWIYSVGAAVNDVVVDAVLDVWSAVRSPLDAFRVGFVLGEQQFCSVLAVDESFPEIRMRSADHAAVGARSELAKQRPIACFRRIPGVAKPERRQHVQRRRLRPTIPDRDLNQDVFRGCLGVFDEHVEVAVLIEHARIKQLIFQLVASPRAVCPHEFIVRIGALRILVEILQIRVRRGRVEIEVVLLDVLAMVAFAVGEAEQALLENRIGAVPQRQGDAQLLLVVAESCKSVLAPAIRARARVIMGEVVPRVAGGAVVLAHRSPLALAEIRPPPLPCLSAFSRGLQAIVFVLGAHRSTSLRLSCRAHPRND